MVQSLGNHRRPATGAYPEATGVDQHPRIGGERCAPVRSSSVFSSLLPGPVSNCGHSPFPPLTLRATSRSRTGSWRGHRNGRPGATATAFCRSDRLDSGRREPLCSNRAGPGFITQDGGLGMKFGWTRGVRGKLDVSGRRLDGAAPPLMFETNNGYRDVGFQASYLIFPTPGCWEVTAQVGEREDSRIAFTVKVVKIGEGPAWRRESANR